MNFIFIGDVHGDWQYCKNIAEKHPNSIVVQLGDLGIGFISSHFFSQLPVNFKFFPGNHDNRTLCNKLSCCLGDYGAGLDGKFFFVSGADSVDKESRIENVTWWANEEITYKQGEDCLDKWVNSKCDILVSHDCPQSFFERGFLFYDRSLTRNLLQSMIEIRKPKTIITAHHHKNFYRKLDDINWISLGVQSTHFIDI